MSARLHNSAIVNHEDVVAVSDGSKAVSDGDDGDLRASSEVTNALHDLALSEGVHR